MKARIEDQWASTRAHWAYVYRDESMFRQAHSELVDIEGQLRELRECYDLILKTARRCCRDLNHAIDNIGSDNQIVAMMRSRVAHYEVVLGGTTDYRNSLHSEIETLKRALAGETF